MLKLVPLIPVLVLDAPVVAWPAVRFALRLGRPVGVLGDMDVSIDE